MRRFVGMFLCLAAIAALCAASAAGAGHRKLVEGTVYDTTCAGTSCESECPPPPHCGPITGRSAARILCPLSEGRVIACPLGATAAAVPAYPVYSVEGAVVKVRRRGSPDPLATLPVT